MGQKTNAVGFRLGVKGLNTIWSSEAHGDFRGGHGNFYAPLLHQDLAIRRYLEGCGKAWSGRCHIQHQGDRVELKLWVFDAQACAGDQLHRRPSLRWTNDGIQGDLSSLPSAPAVRGLHWRDPAHVEQVRRGLEKLLGRAVNLQLVVGLDAKALAESVALEIQRKKSPGDAVKQLWSGAGQFSGGKPRDGLAVALDSFVEDSWGNRLMVQGVKMRISGRLNGVEMARDEAMSAGRLPFQTLAVPVDQGSAEAMTPHGVIGVRIWIAAQPGSVAEDSEAFREVPGAKSDGTTKYGF